LHLGIFGIIREIAAALGLETEIATDLADRVSVLPRTIKRVRV
jgi:hypothetical protein